MNRPSYVKAFFHHNKVNTGLEIMVYMADAVLNLIISWFIQVITDIMAGSLALDFRQTLYLYGGILTFVLLIQVTEYWTFPSFIQKAMNQYKDRVFHDLLKKNLASFSSENTATYISALTNDVVTIEANFLKQFFEIIRMLVLFFGALGLMFYYHLSLTLIVLGLSVVPLVISLVTANQLTEKERKVSQQNESYVATSKDILNGFSVVKSFQAEDQVERVYQKQNHLLEALKKERDQTSIIVKSIGNLASLSVQMGIMVIGVWFVLNGVGGLTPGKVMAFTNLMNFVLQPISQIPQLLGQAKASLGLVEKVSNYLQANTQDGEKYLGNGVEDGFEINHLSLSYDGSKQALLDFNFHFEIGKSYAIVGGSGSGKSSLVNCLMGNFNDYQGSVQLDGVEIKELSKESLYSYLSLIQQTVFIFDATIVENVTLYKDFPQSEIDRVIKLSGLDKLLAERGRDYKCGENGNKLSGGERQRVAIARSLLKDSQIILVDEATSALDNPTAIQISQALLNLKSLMRVVVTHRLDQHLLEQYDQILVLKDGQLIETGKFHQLMAAKGYFYSLYTVSN